MISAPIEGERTYLSGYRPSFRCGAGAREGRRKVTVIFYEVHFKRGLESSLGFRCARGELICRGRGTRRIAVRVGRRLYVGHARS